MKFVRRFIVGVVFSLFPLLCVGCDKVEGGSVSFDRIAFTMGVNTEVEIKATVTTEADLFWKSSNNKVCKVDKNGNVKGISKGNATITATVRGGSSATCEVNVGFVSQNPILPPEWNLYIADGEPHVFDGKLYLYGSRDVANGELPDGSVNWCSDKYNVIFTEDMINWIDGGVVIDISDMPETKGTRMWAPDVCYNPVDSLYYMYICFNGNDMPFVVATSSSPAGPFSNAKTLLYDDGTPVTGGIDPSVFIDSDGTGYIYWSNMRGAKFVDGDMAVVAKKSVKNITGMKFPFEGPSIRKIGDKYYFIYIQNDGPITGDNISPTCMAYMMGDSPLGPFKYKGIIISNTDYPNAGNIHGSIQCFNDEWFVFYHRPVCDMRLTRVACAERISFNEDGAINEVMMTSSGVRDAFKPDEQIQASSAVVFSNGRFDNSYHSVENGFAVIKLDSMNSDDDNLTYLGYRYVDFEDGSVNKVVLNSASANGAVVEFRLDAPNGDVIASFDVSSSEAKSVNCSLLKSVSGLHSVYVVLIDGSCDINWFTFITE